MDWDICTICCVPPAGPIPWLALTRRAVQWNADADFWLDVAEFERLGP